MTKQDIEAEINALLRRYVEGGVLPYTTTVKIDASGKSSVITITKNDTGDQQSQTAPVGV